MSELSHKVKITVSGNYPDGYKKHASVSVFGDGGIEHMLEAFQATLVAAGFPLSTVKVVEQPDPVLRSCDVS